MNKVKVQDNIFDIESEANGLKGTINGNSFLIDLLESGKDKFHLLYQNRSININVISVADDRKSAQLQLNGKTLEVSLQDSFDLLLKNLGISAGQAKKVNEIKAPMPGLVLRLEASEGALIKKGEALLVLEAMKMENIIKAPEDVTVGRIHVEKGQAVEKNQLLISFA